MKVIQELAFPSPLHVYKVIDFRVWKDTEGFLPAPTLDQPTRSPYIKVLVASVKKAELQVMNDVIKFSGSK
jgi:hypothetical protein